MTTLGVIGLGRIGAFHTETLSGLDGVDLAGRRQASDRLVAVEIGGEGVPLGGCDHGVEQFALGAARRLHRAQRRVHRPHHGGAVQRLHRATERRRDLQQVSDPADVC